MKDTFPETVSKEETDGLLFTTEYISLHYIIDVSADELLEM